MRSFTIILTLTIGFALLSAASIFAADAPHDYSKAVDCQTCHEYHPSPDADVGTVEGKLNLCRSCHNPAGVKDAEVHSHPGMPDTICTDCHDPHSQEQAANGSTYGKFMRTTIQTPNSGSKTVVFKGATGSKSFADGDSTYDGICEVCHTTTSYHRNNSSGDHTHHAGENCTTCHSHVSGFGAGASKSCLDCHNQTQGARRQVVDGTAGPGDFSRRSHHAYTSASQSVTAADCVVCHSTAGHLSKSVKLNNPDGGTAYTFSGTGASIEGFCLGCHDGNSANGNTKPLSDGKTPSDIAFGTIYSTALHNVRGLSCYGTGQSGTGCHANGHGSKKKFHLAPDNVAANTTNYSEEEEGACIVCHGSSGPGKNIAGQLTKTRNHGMNSAAMAGRHAINEPITPATYSGANRHVECTDCHNQHWLQSGTTHTAGTNNASDVIKYISRVKATYGTTANVVPTFTAVSARDTSAAKEYEICFKCHSSWAYGSNPPTTPENTVETDASIDFNPNNKSFHPVVGQVQNSYTIPTSTNGNKQTMNAPWDTTTHKTMYCSDCHKSETTTDPKGPHGSTNNYMLPVSDTEKALCLLCHKSSVYAPSSATSSETGSRFDQQTTGNSADSHYYHVTSRGISCRKCHGAVRTLPSSGTGSIAMGSMHGTNTVAGLMNGRNIKAYSPGSCTPTCHSSKSYTAGSQ